MKKFIFTSLALLSGMLFLIQGTHAQESTDVRLTITGGNVTIGSTGTFDFGSFSSLSTDQTSEKQFTGDAYFWVQDLKGADAGYYTTLSISNLSGQTVGNDDYIAATGVEIKLDAATNTLIDGDINANVVADASVVGSYVVFDSGNVRTFIKRDNAVNSNKIGKYAVWPWLQITIPAFLTPDDYQGTITYTLYEN